jgi:wyosine [tRNA(Phe)-imidazoG37] synthetase (radical SAM superfamily)
MQALIFGPVTSRRFGLSLGVDLSPKDKQCNFDCLYCELAPAKVVASSTNFPNPKDVIEAVKKGIFLHQDVKYITLTANGEPTLYPHLNEVVDGIKALKLPQKLLILSNSSTINDEKIIKILHKIDSVKLSLDTANEQIFKKLDRPIEGIKISNIIDGIIKFAKEYEGELILEVLVVKGLNDTTKDFKELNEVFNLIKPARIDIGTIDRPPAYKVEGVSTKRLNELASHIKGLPISINKKAEYKTSINLDKDEILKLVERRPQSRVDIDSSFTKESKIFLNELFEEGLVKIENVAGMEFICLTKQRF